MLNNSNLISHNIVDYVA